MKYVMMGMIMINVLTTSNVPDHSPIRKVILPTYVLSQKYAVNYVLIIILSPMELL